MSCRPAFVRSPSVYLFNLDPIFLLLWNLKVDGHIPSQADLDLLSFIHYFMVTQLRLSTWSRRKTHVLQPTQSTLGLVMPGSTELSRFLDTYIGQQKMPHVDSTANQFSVQDHRVNKTTDYSDDLIGKIKANLLNIISNFASHICEALPQNYKVQAVKLNL